MEERKGSVARALCACVVAQFIFGTYPVVVSPWKDKVDVVMLCVLRDGLAFPVLLVASALLEGLRVPPREDWLPLCALGLQLYGGQLLYLVGVYLCSADIASIFQPLIPVVTLVISLAIGYETVLPLTLPTCAKIVGICIATGGALMMVLVSGVDGGGSPAGVVVLLGGTVCISLYVILQKHYVYKAPPESLRRQRYEHRPVSFTAWTYLVVALLMVVSAVVRGLTMAHPEDLVSMPASALIPALYAALLNSALAYALLTFANKTLSASITTSFYPQQVLTTSVLSYIFLHERLTVLVGVGGGLIIVGMLCVACGNLYVERESKATQLAETSPYAGLLGSTA